MSDSKPSPDALVPAATPADGRPAAADRSESLRTELAALSAILPPVGGPGRPDVLPSLQASLGSAYVLERELGGGGMSRVFVATETALGRRVAVKVLAPELLQGVSADRFAREVALAARLQDPHIVPVLTTGTAAGGLPWYTMPFIEGESLRERMARGPVGLEEAVRILRDMAEALEYAHARGIVHRDIKPENVLLSGRNAVVADFGIAKAVSAARAAVPGGTLTSIGLSLGTPAYMAPEQAGGDAVDHRADLYAWGMVAYELLAGAHPFAPRTQAAQLIAAQITELPRPLDEVRPGLPPTLGTLVMACVAKAPDARPADAAAVLAALGGATTDLALTSGRRAPVTMRMSKRRQVGAAAALVLALGAGGAWFTLGGADRGAAAAADATPSVAVLPFEHQGDTADAYLTDGITDEVRNKLTGVSNLLVIARASSNQYRDTDKTPQAIAAELGVRWLLTGTVRVVGTGDERRVLVRPELVEVTADGRLQSRGGTPFDGPLTDMVGAQGMVAEQVVRSMEVAAGGEDQARLVAVPTRDAEAYDLYLRGRAAANDEVTVAATRRALEYYEAAGARDSGLVDAWRAIGLSYAVLYVNETPSPEHARRARAALAQLERIAPGSAEVHRLRSTIFAYIDGDNEGAYRELQAAARLAPGDPRVLADLAGTEAELGRFDEALRGLESASRVDPREASLHALRAWVLNRLRRFDESRAAASRARALSPTSMTIIDTQVRTELGAGDLAAARRLLAEAAADVPRDQLLAYVATYWDRWWLPEGADAARLLELPQGAFISAEAYHIVRAEALYHGGDRTRARAHADSAMRDLGEALRTAPQNAQLHILQGLGHAYAGRPADAMAATERGLELARARPGIAQTDELAYFHYVAARTATVLGDRARAVAWVRACLATRPIFTAAWLRLDPTFAPLRSDPAFERTLAEAP